MIRGCDGNKVLDQQRDVVYNDFSLMRILFIFYVEMT